MFGNCLKAGLTAICVLLSIQTAVSAEYLKVEKITDKYALRENGDLVQYRDAEDNMTVRIACDVIDFNNSVYITKDGKLYTVDGKYLSDNAKKVITKPIYIADGYNGEYACIDVNNRLVLMDFGEYKFGGMAISNNVAQAYGNFVLKNDGELSIIIPQSGTKVVEKKLIDNVKGIYGNKGEYLALDNNDVLWYIPWADGKFIGNFETLKIGENILSCDSMDRIITKNGEWLDYDMAELTAGNVKVINKSSNVLFAFGDSLYINKSRYLMCYYHGKEVKLSENSREAFQSAKGKMNGYYIDQADILFRVTHRSNELTLLGLSDNAAEFLLCGDDFAIYKQQNGIVYGVDKAVTFGTGVITEKNDYSDAVVLPICMKEVKVIKDGEEVKLKHRIIEKEGRNFFAFGEFAKMFGAAVEYSETDGTAKSVLNGVTLQFTDRVGSYKINGEKKLMDSVAFIDELTEEMYVPVRYAAEAFGIDITWKSEDKENYIILHSKKQ